MPSMTKEVRALYNLARARAKAAGLPEKLYHQSNDVEGLMANPRTDLGANEPWKDSALYTSDNLFDNLLSRVGEGGTLTNLKEDLTRMGVKNKAGMVRVVPKPDASLATMSEKDLIQGKSTGLQDILRLTDVDEGAVPAEYLIRNPKAVSIFSKDKVWNPMTAGLVAGGALAGTSGDAEAASYDKLLPILGEDLARRLANVSKRQSTQDQLGNWIKGRYPNLVEKGEFGGQTVQQKVQESTKSLVDTIKDNPLNPLPQMKYKAEQLGMNPDQLAAAVRYQYVNDPESLKRLMTSDVWEKIKKFAGITGAGVAGVTLAGGDAEASPLGRLSGVLKKLDSNDLRHNEAFDKLVGRTLNLQGPEDIERVPYTVVDVLRKGKSKDSYLVQVKDEQGHRRQLPMTKDYLEVLLGAHGTQQYVQEFKGKRHLDKKLQALKALGIRQEKRDSGPLESYQDFKAWNASQATKAHEIDPALVNDYRYLKPAGAAKNEEVYLPKEYAEFLADKSYGDILEPGPNPGKLFNHESKPATPKQVKRQAVSNEQLNVKAREITAQEDRELQLALTRGTPDQEAKAHKIAQRYYVELGERPRDMNEYNVTYLNILNQVVKGIR